MFTRFRPILSNSYYFITSVTFKRYPLLAEPSIAQIVVDQWLHYEEAYEFQLNAYSVLPDHVHVVLNVGSLKTISQILHAVNSYTATLINQHLNRNRKTKIWQGKPWDTVIRDEEMYWGKIAYTLFNPWREGRVNEPFAKYQFSNLEIWCEREGYEFMTDLFYQFKDRLEEPF